MNTMCENFDANYDDTLGVDRPFIFACRDRTARYEERWVLASLSNEEAKKVHTIEIRMAKGNRKKDFTVLAMGYH